MNMLKEPKRFNYCTLTNKMYLNQRNPNRPLYFDFLKLKIGRQCITNRIFLIVQSIRLPWQNPNLSHGTIRAGLEKSFFYFTITKVA